MKEFKFSIHNGECGSFAVNSRGMFANIMFTTTSRGIVGDVFSDYIPAFHNGKKADVSLLDTFVARGLWHQDACAHSVEGGCPNGCTCKFAGIRGTVEVVPAKT